jgi:hypothetical protein
MKKTSEFPGFFDNPYILGPFYHAKEGRVPGRIGTDGTGIAVGITPAAGTAPD